MDPYLISLIISYDIDDVDDSLISSLSDKQKSHLLKIFGGKIDDRLQSAIQKGHLEKVKLFFFLIPTTHRVNPYVRKAVTGGHHAIVKFLYDNTTKGYRTK